MSKKKSKKKRRKSQTRPGAEPVQGPVDHPTGLDAQPVEATKPQASTIQLGPSQIGWTNFFCLLLCIAAQACTIWISWPAWEFRPLVDQTIPNLPWIAGTPQFSTGVLLLVSLGLAAISPKRFGLMLHLGLLFLSIAMDQFRCQPQVIAIALMMAACVWPTARRICVWYLIAMWTWAGIHKLFSPDWFGPVTGYLLSDFQSGLGDDNPEPNFLLSEYYKAFAAIVVVSEITTGLLAWFRPKIGAIACVLLHVGIAIFMFVLDWNYSVLPWNVATAIVGAWLLWNVRSNRSEAEEVSPDSNLSGILAVHHRVRFPSILWEKCVVVFLLLMPIGFYFGFVRHCFAHALYSNNLPLAVMTRNDRFEDLDSWDQLKLPFPHVEKAFLDYFRETGVAGDRLEILDTMYAKRVFYQHDGAKEFHEITEEQFYKNDAGEFLSVGIDDPRIVFQLELFGANMLKRSQSDMIYAISFDQAHFRPTDLDLLSGLPNLEQIQLANCELSDDDLDRIPILPRLAGIGLSDTAITDAGVEHLKKQPNLLLIEYENTAISPNAILEVIE